MNKAFKVLKIAPSNIRAILRLATSAPPHYSFCGGTIV